MKIFKVLKAGSSTQDSWSLSGAWGPWMVAFMFAFLILAGRSKCFSQTVMLLYKDKIPNSRQSPDEEKSSYTKDGLLIISGISRPTLTAYFPETRCAARSAVIICPGGGYSVEAAGHEGADVARAFNAMGVVAFVLKYRLPSEKTMISPEIGPLQDGQRAIQEVREHASEWGIDTAKIGLMGFSAGGHLASTVGTHFDRSLIKNKLSTSLRPDFLVLIYPVISFTDSIGHIGSRDQLIGKNPSQEKIREYSNEFQVTNSTPPTFLVQAKDDDVSVENAIVFARALQSHNVSHQLFLYERGGHGYGMNNKKSDIRWMDILKKWMIANSFL